MFLYGACCYPRRFICSYVTTASQVIEQIRREIEKIRSRFRRGEGNFPGHSKHMRRRYCESLRPKSRATQAKRGELVKGQEAVKCPFSTLPISHTARVERLGLLRYTETSVTCLRL